MRGAAEGGDREAVRVGPYRLLERLGEGGMGEVYRAERVEDFSQIVAVKLLVRGLGDQEILRRFHTERQVLASLQHPNIVRLLDAGVSTEGVPYIAMEYVEGVPLDRFCNEKKLDRDARLRLMIQALDAVEYAHQRFLVHCDLKYSNILVTEDGTAKLLDFGIAKLLRPAQYGFGESLTREFRPMTLEFASPEQLRSGKVSTATDIYACGILLYGLLTGQHPFQDLMEQPVAFADAVQNGDPEAPSHRARRIANPPVPAGLTGRDLDAIAGKALRKEPEARYRSVERFAGDLRRYLAGLPVEAREGSFSYRAAKFIRRNRATAIVAGALAAAVVLGVAGTIFESMRAQQQRRRAEARFNDTRKLANSLLFGFYDSVSKLPGATHAQQLIVARSLSYLDHLAGESKGNEDLQLDLADGYVKLAALEGSPNVPNAGLPKQALATADKAIGVAAGLARGLPRDYRAYFTLASAHGAKGDALLWLGQVPQSIQESRTTIEILEKLVAARREDVPTLIAAAAAHETLGDKLAAAAALIEYRQSLQLMENARKLAPAEFGPRRAVVVERMKIAGLISDSDPEQGLALFNEAVSSLDNLTSRELQESQSRHLRGWMLRRRAETETLLGRYDEADRDFAEMQQFTDSILAMDRSDAQAKLDLAAVMLSRGDLERARGRPGSARDYYQQVVSLLEEFPGLEQSIQARAALDDALVSLGSRKTTQRGLADLRAMAAGKDASPEILEKAAEDFLDAQPADFEDARFALDCVNRALEQRKSPVALETKAQALVRLGDRAGARTAALSGLALFPAANPGVPARGLRLRLTQLAH